MRRLAALGFAVISTIAAIVLVAAYPAIVESLRFEAHRSEMRRLIENSDPENRTLPPSVQDLLLFVLNGRTLPHATRLLIGEFDEQALGSQSAFNAASAGWYWLVALH